MNEILSQPTAKTRNASTLIVFLVVLDNCSKKEHLNCFETTDVSNRQSSRQNNHLRSISLRQSDGMSRRLVIKIIMVVIPKELGHLKKKEFYFFVGCDCEPTFFLPAKWAIFECVRCHEQTQVLKHSLKVLSKKVFLNTKATVASTEIVTCYSGVISNGGSCMSDESFPITRNRKVFSRSLV
jgi:hypothetical protein